MSFMWRPCLLLLSTLLASVGNVARAAGDQGWKDKQIAEWSQEDAKQVLSDSPWAKTVTPSMSKPNGQRRPGGQGGRISIGVPGIGGIGRPGGIGGPGIGGGYPPRGSRTGGTTGGRDEDAGTEPNAPPTLTLRWESALPVRAAELKARDTSAPIVDEGHYAIAVYGVPSRMANGDPQRLASELKKQAAIKREGQKDLKPSSVEVLQRDDGPVIVYLFPRTKEFTKDDNRLRFDAEIGRLQFAESFYLADMVYQGKREL